MFTKKILKIFLVISVIYAIFYQFIIHRMSAAWFSRRFRNSDPPVREKQTDLGRSLPTTKPKPKLDY